MIQFNLLPAIKIEYIKARRTKRLVTLVAGLVIAVTIPVVLSLAAIVFVWQPQRMRSLDSTIKKNSKALQSTTDINKILTIQNQLTSIDKLHSGKPYAGRVFGYIQQLTPATTSLQSATTDFEANTMTLTGHSSALAEVNKFIDTLKFTTITRTGDSDTTKKAFSNVVLSSFGLDEKGGNFSITMKYDLAIFDINETAISLTVPKISTTRSETERPADLFQQTTTGTTK